LAASDETDFLHSFTFISHSSLSSFFFFAVTSLPYFLL
jgi:hypothetical protein